MNDYKNINYQKDYDKLLYKTMIYNELYCITLFWEI